MFVISLTKKVEIISGDKQNDIIATTYVFLVVFLMVFTESKSKIDQNHGWQFFYKDQEILEKHF